MSLPAWELTVTFDKPLVSQLCSGAYWIGKFNNENFAPAANYTPAGNSLTFACNHGGVVAGDIVSYYGGDNNLIGTNGLPVEAFIDYPVTLA